jgi:hypothetical protein
MYEVVRVYYHQLHSILPREAVLVEPVDGERFRTYAEAEAHMNAMIVGGEYTYAPMKVTVA